jgi:hypothetical protein
MRIALGGFLAAVLGLAGWAAVTSDPASGERVQLGKLILDVDGGFSPTALPKREFAPIALRGEGDISTTDGTLPPPPSGVEIDWDRNGELTNKGLPVCEPSKIENTTTPAALDVCRKALVGVGFGSGMVAFPDDPPFSASSKVLAFNGPQRGGVRTIILHAYALVPAPTTFVVPVDVTRVNRGRYGWHSSLVAPVIAGGYGVVTHFDLTINRRYKFKGKKLSFLSARCADGRLQARGAVSFGDGTSMFATVFRPCRTRG